MTNAVAKRSLLLCGVGSRRCALNLDHVVETMRPLPITSVMNVAPFVSGVAVIRGEVVPVIDGGVLVGMEPTIATRFVLVRVGGRRVALAVDLVLGIQELDETELVDLPPLLAGANSDAVGVLGRLDSELLFVLENTRLVPDSVWLALEEAAAS